MVSLKNQALDSRLHCLVMGLLVSFSSRGRQSFLFRYSQTEPFLSFSQVVIGPGQFGLDTFVYRNNGRQFREFGSILFGGRPTENGVMPIAVSGDGSTIAMKTWGEVEIYAYNGTDYELENSNITSWAPRFGEHLSLSEDGGRLAVGDWELGTCRFFSALFRLESMRELPTTANFQHPPHTVSFTDYGPGFVKVYQRAENGTWGQLGQAIVGEENLSVSGWYANLSPDGSTVAFGSPHNSDGGLQSGSVRVYRLNEENDAPLWEQLGQDLDGFFPGDQLGKSSSHFDFPTVRLDSADFAHFLLLSLRTLGVSVDLSRDGNIVTFGGYTSNINGAKSGYIAVYEYEAERNTWTQIGRTIMGLPGAEFGRAVSISADGKTLVGGGPGYGQPNLVYPFRSGYVQVWQQFE